MTLADLGIADSRIGTIPFCTPSFLWQRVERKVITAIFYVRDQQQESHFIFLGWM